MGDNKYLNNFGTGATNIQIQQNTSNSTQMQNVKTQFDYDGAHKLIQQIIKELPQMGLPYADCEEASKLTKDIEERIVAKEDKSVIKKGLSLLKDIFTRTAASLAAAGALHLIKNFFASGV